MDISNTYTVKYRNQSGDVITLKPVYYLLDAIAAANELAAKHEVQLMVNGAHVTGVDFSSNK